MVRGEMWKRRERTGQEKGQGEQGKSVRGKYEERAGETEEIISVEMMTGEQRVTDDGREEKERGKDGGEKER